MQIRVTDKLPTEAGRYMMYDKASGVIEMVYVYVEQSGVVACVINGVGYPCSSLCYQWSEKLSILSQN